MRRRFLAVAILCSLSVQLLAQGPVRIRLAANNGALPAGFSQTDIGTGQLTGNCQYNSGTWTVTGSGITFGTSDQARFCYETVTGNWEIIAHVTNCTTTYIFGQECGVMVRGSTAANSSNFSCFIGDTDATDEWRSTDGGSTGSNLGSAMTSGWVKLHFVAGVNTCSTSSDGVTWNQLATDQGITISSTYLIGIKVDSNFTAQLATGTFTSVSITSITGGGGGGLITDNGGYRPQYEGPGANSVGGRSGKACTVNTLSISGFSSPVWGESGTKTIFDCVAGKRPECDLAAQTPATCATYTIFAVGGMIDLGGNEIYTGHAFQTIAGQTAPKCSEGTGTTCTGDAAAGIELKGGAIKVVYNDVVIQHVRIRPGHTYYGHGLYFGDPAQGSPFENVYVYRTVADHLSISWGGTIGSSNTGVTGTSGEDLIVDSLFAEPVWGVDAPAPPGQGGPLFLWGGHGFGVNQDHCGPGAMMRNLFMSAWYRMPWLGPGCEVTNVNALAYNASTNGTDNGGFSHLISDDNHFGFAVAPTHYTAVNNTYLAGPNTHSPVAFLTIAHGPLQAAQANRVYLSGNTDDFGSITGSTGDGQWHGVALCNCGFLTSTSSATQGNTRIDTPDSYYSSVGYHLLATSDVAAYVRLNAGAFPNERDAVDTRLVLQSTQGTGGTANLFLVSEVDAGGYPTIVSRSWTPAVPATPNAIDVGHTGFSNGVRTVMEYWLETMARRLEPNTGVS